ncbi:Ribonuclease H-like domain containing protein [Russula decolorans]
MPPDAFLDRFLPSHSISIPEGTPNFQVPLVRAVRLSLLRIRQFLTADVWSSGNFSSYLALTCHWISDKGPNGSLLLKSALIGFHRLKNKHTGKNIARNILHLLKRAGITSKIGHFTLDNAENNATAMRELEALLKLHDDDIEFDHLNNRIRCYPHIINICSSHIIASSTCISKRFLETLKSEFAGDLVYSNIEGLKRDPIKRARRIVRIVRSSDQRKQAFKKVINTGNHSGWFRSHDNEVIELPDLELLRDVKTRWDSVYCMIERLLVLRPAIDFFFSMKVHGLTEYKLTDLDWELLDALYAVLAVSFYPNSDSSAVRSTRCTGSSYGSANHVGRIDASALRSCSVFRNLHDPMGKTLFQVPRVETLGRRRLRVG